MRKPWGAGEVTDLYDAFPLHFTGLNMGVVSVAEVLANLDLYDGKALIDPCESGEYGMTTAKFFANKNKGNGKPFINSFAHGNRKYFLKLSGLGVKKTKTKKSKTAEFKNMQDAVGSVGPELKQDIDSTENKAKTEQQKPAPETKAVTQKSNAFGLPGLNSRHGTASTWPLTEKGNAERLLEAFVNNLFYVVPLGWIHWKNNAWLWDIDEAMCRSLAAKLPEQIYDEAREFISDVLIFGKWALDSQKSSIVRAAVSILRDFAEVRMPVTLLDANPFLIGFDNARQVIDLKIGNHRLANQDDFITKSLGVSTVGKASKAVRWLRFLEEIFNGNTELIEWIQRHCGYTLTGLTIEDLVLFLFGGGRNGKSVFTGVLNKIMNEYACVLNVESLLEGPKKSGSDATPDIVRLVNVRSVLSTEVPECGRINEARFKEISGGDKMTARGLHQGFIDFTPQFKLTLFGNHKPIIKGTDSAIWSRMALVPFTRNFEAEGTMDLNLRETLMAEAPHIVAWMVEGCLKWQREGLRVRPKVVVDSTKEYQREQDLIGQWLDEYCIVEVNEKDTVSNLFDKYRVWAQESNVWVISKPMFGKKLRERGFEEHRIGEARYFKGLRAKKYEERYAK